MFSHRCAPWARSCQPNETAKPSSKRPPRLANPIWQNPPRACHTEQKTTEPQPPGARIAGLAGQRLGQDKIKRNSTILSLGIFSGACGCSCRCSGSGCGRCCVGCGGGWGFLWLWRLLWLCRWLWWRGWLCWCGGERGCCGWRGCRRGSGYGSLLWWWWWLCWLWGLSVVVVGWGWLLGL